MHVQSFILKNYPASSAYLKGKLIHNGLFWKNYKKNIDQMCLFYELFIVRMDVESRVLAFSDTWWPVGLLLRYLQI